MTLQRMALLASGVSDYVPSDPDAAAYVALVDAADGQILETAVKIAINDFVIGCKTDGIWSAIKACCLLMGARTLAGALVPLVGAAPTNFNFLAGDYNRKTGLAGNGSTKYLNLSRNSTDDPRDNVSCSVYITTAGTGNRAAISAFSGSDLSEIAFYSGCYTALRSSDNRLSGADGTTGFIGLSRSSGASFTALNNTTSYTHNVASVTPSASPWFLFRRPGAALYSNGRYSFYHIGQAFSQALLRDRVIALSNAIAAAIP